MDEDLSRKRAATNARRQSSSSDRQMIMDRDAIADVIDIVNADDLL